MRTEYITSEYVSDAAFTELYNNKVKLGWPYIQYTHTKTCNNDYPYYFTVIGSKYDSKTHTLNDYQAYFAVIGSKYDSKTHTLTTARGNEYLQYCDGSAVYIAVSLMAALVGSVGSMY